MNFELFTARRIIASSDNKGSVSAPIIKIAIAAIAAWMVIMILSVAAGLGLQQKIREKVSAFNGEISIIHFDNQSQLEDQTPIDLPQNFYPKFSQVEAVEHIQATAHKAGIILTDQEFEGVILKGVGPDYRWELMAPYITSGHYPETQGNLNNQLMISSTIAQRLNIALGDTINTFFLKGADEQAIRSRGFKVVGFYESGFEDFDRQYIFSDIRHVQRLNRWTDRQVGRFELFTDQSQDLTQIADQVYQLTPGSLNTISMSEAYYAIFEWLSLFDFNIYLIIGIMILIASINMITALLVLILERTQMIGVLKSLGSTNWSIRKMFLYQAGYIIGLGLFWGNLIGLFMIGIQSYFGIITLDPATYYVRYAPVHLPLDLWVWLNAGTFILCLCLLLLPSYLVTKITPVEAMRFDG